MPRIITLTPNPTFDFAVDADFVRPNRKLRCKNPQSHPGGGGINVARAAHRLGADTLAIITSGGLYGEAVERLMAEEEVPVRTIPVKGETRIAFHVKDLEGHQEFRFNLPGAEMDGDETAAMLAAVAEEANAGDFVIGSGSLPGGEPNDFWARAAKVAKDKGAHFVLDSINGVKPALEEGIFLLRQNKFEYPLLSGGELRWPDEIIAFAQSIVDAGGAERVAITHGGDGSIMTGPNGPARVGALPIKAESAVGAGDSFVAAMCYALARGAEDEDALTWGMSAAAATRLSPGTSLFKPEDVNRLYAQATAG